MKLAIIVLAALNVLLLGAWAGLFGPVAGDAPDPQRLAQQVRPEQLRVVGPGSGGGGSGAAPAGGASTTAGSSVAAPDAASAAAAAAGGVAAGDAGTSAGTGTASVGAAGPGAAAPSATGSTAAIPVPAGLACIEWGLFTEAELARAQAALAQAAPAARVEPLRSDAGPRSWIVHVPPLPDLAAAQARAAELRAAGFDVYVLRDGPLRNGISLGLFRQEEAALAQQRDLVRRGLAEAQIASRGAERWVLRATSDAPLAPEQRAALAGRFRDRPVRACGA